MYIPREKNLKLHSVTFVALFFAQVQAGTFCDGQDLHFSIVDDFNLAIFGFDKVTNSMVKVITWLE